MRILVLLACTFALLSCAPSNADLDKMYPPPWRDGPESGIAGALSRANIDNCPQYKYRQSKDSDSEFLVNCSEDGHAWRSYFVFTRAGTVQGTSTVDP